MLENMVEYNYRKSHQFPVIKRKEDVDMAKPKHHRPAAKKKPPNKAAGKKSAVIDTLALIANLLACISAALSIFDSIVD